MFNETFENITKSRKLDKVLNVASAIKSKHGEKSPVVGARIVVTNIIYKETLDILDTLQKREYDYVLFKLVRDYESRGLGIEAKDFCIGDLNEMPLDDIWNSDKHLRVKELSDEKRKNRECKNCRAITYNNMIHSLLHALHDEYDAFI